MDGLDRTNSAKFVKKIEPNWTFNIFKTKRPIQIRSLFGLVQSSPDHAEF